MSKGYNELDRGLTEKEFMQEACKMADCVNVQTAQKWWSAFQEVITRQMLYYGFCRLPGICKIDSKYVEQGKQKQIDKDRVEHIYFVEERKIPTFEANDDFINDINGMGVTKLYRRRDKTDTLTKRDMERELRAEVLEAKENGDWKKYQELNAELMEKKKKFKPKRQSTKKKSIGRKGVKGDDAET